MSFKDYFSSKIWFDGVKGHVMNIALTDLDERGAKPYIMKEVVLFNFDTVVGGVIYCVSNSFSALGNLFTIAVGWTWDQTLGRIFNNPKHHNTDKTLDQTETRDEIKTPPTHDSPVVFHETIPTEAYELNSLNGEILDQGSLEDASGANVAMMI